MKHVILFFLLLGGMASLHAQNPTRITIQGIIQDTTGSILPAATVMLLQPKDSALVNFTRSDEKGFFSFKNVKNSGYLLKISYVSYLPFQQAVPVSSKEEVDMGILRVKPIAKELMEVVIRAAKAPLSIRGDTIEYDATTFKVPPGSTVEDLLRRLPGIEVDADGNIKAHGKDIQRVLVDGKTFFGTDPKAATKNLGAETISKVQVFTDKSEQSKITGVDDGKREKAMNLELKEEFKKGAFGKATVAGGTKSRWATRGNYNRFNKKEQFSIIGFGNNINETGVNWSDYEEFKGNNTFSSDNEDFGFNNDGGGFFWGNNPLGNTFDGRGFTKNAGGGVNYNYTHKKTQLSTSYFYNQTHLTLSQQERKQTFLERGSFFTQDTLQRNTFRNNHTLSFRLEQMLDSSNIVIVKANLVAGTSDADANRTQQYLAETGTLRNRLFLTNANTLGTFNLNTSFVYRHSFKKKGRVAALSGGYTSNMSDKTEGIYSENRFFDAIDPNTQIRLMRQENTEDNTQQEWKSSAFFLETLSKRWQSESFYNFRYMYRTVDRNAFNTVQNRERQDSLSTYYTNQLIYNRLGSNVRYAYNGLNISVGGAVVRYDLHGRIASSPTEHFAESISRQFVVWVPYLSMNMDLKNNTYLGTTYSMTVEAPNLEDLQPVIQNNNPYFITTGNPDLSPQKSHTMNINFYKFNANTFMNLWTGLDLSYFLSQVVYTQTIDENLVTRTRPENLSGGKRFSFYLGSRFPLIKTKLQMNMQPSISMDLSPTYINGVQNQTDNRSYNIRTGWTLTPHEKLIFDLQGTLSYTTISYSIERQQNQQIQNYGVKSSVKWNFAPKFFFESNFDYTRYRNDRFGFRRDIPIWNASVRRLFLKDNKLEMRLAIFDIFNQQVNIRQFGGLNTVTQQTASTLARYAMLSVSYNLRGYPDKLQKNNR